MFDEHGAPIPKRFGQPGFEPRVGKTPCETSLGCPKGHWQDNPDLNQEQEEVIKLFKASQATGGKCLTDAESKDWFLTLMFAELWDVLEAARSDRTTASIQQLAALFIRQ